METNPVATLQEVETLKQKWLTEPTFDLSELSSQEVGQKFAPFREELRTFQEKMEVAWAQAAAVNVHSLKDGLTKESSSQLLNTTNQQVLAEKALQRYLHIVLSPVPEEVRDDLGELIKIFVETSVRFYSS